MMHESTSASMARLLMLADTAKKRDVASAADVRVTGTLNNVRAKIGRNEPCPCGSGKKHKKCCLKAAAQPAPLRRPVRRKPGAVEAPGAAPTDSGERRASKEAVGDALRRAGLAEEIVYAYTKMQRLITPQTRAAYDAATLAEWDKHIEDWRAEHGEEDQGGVQAAAP